VPEASKSVATEPPPICAKALLDGDQNFEPEVACLIVETAPDAVVTMDIEGLVTGWNKQAENLFGWTAPEAVGRQLSETIIPAAERVAYKGGLRRLLDTGGGPNMNRRVEITALHRQGYEIPVEIAVTAVPRRGSYVFSAFLRNLSERRETEAARTQLLAAEHEARSEAEAARQRAALLAEASAALLASSLDYETVLSNVAQIIVPGLATFCAVDLVTEDGLVQEVTSRHANPAKVGLAHNARTYGAGTQANPGALRATYQVLRSGQTELSAEISDDSLADWAVDADHLRLMRESGVKSTMLVPLISRGETMGVVTFGLTDTDRRFGPADVTLAEELTRRIAAAIDSARLYQEARQAEQELRDVNRDLEQRVSERTVQLEAVNRELEIASRHKSEFLANMSHELRTPLNGIIGFSEVLLDADLDNMAKERRTSFLGNIQRSGRHLLGLINDILDLSKVEAGRMELCPERLSLRPLIEGCMDIVRPAANKKQLQLETGCDPVDAEISADAPRLKQILYNLLSNAVKFTPEGGTISVLARVTDKAAEIEVRDNGIGIKPEDQALVFEEFRQVDVGITRQHEGTGLGLALVRSLVDLHGGAIVLQSASGEGSCFTVTLPAPAASAGAQPASGSPAETDLAGLARQARSDRPLVVVVEDNREASELLTLHLTQVGYEVRRSFPECALDVIRETHPFAVTLDVLMPGHDGWCILQALKSDPETREVPVVIVSVDDNRERGLALGAAEYLVKPVERDVLVAALAGLDGGGSAGKQRKLSHV